MRRSVGGVPTSTIIHYIQFSTIASRIPSSMMIHLTDMNTREVRHTLGKNNLLESLPVELLPRVLLKLDCLSLRSLLQAYPWLSSRCALIMQPRRGYVARPLPCCFFEPCAGLATVSLDDQCNGPVAMRKYLLKIYVLESYSTRWGLRPTWNDLEKRLPFFNKSDCLVLYFQQADISNRGGFEWARQHQIASVLKSKGVVVHIAPPKHREVLATSKEEVISITNVANSLRRSAVFRNLRVIRIEGMGCVQGITFSPYLMSLTVIFNSSHQDPVLRDLVFPDGFLSFSLSIYYEDKVPFIENLVFEGGPEHREVGLLRCKLLFGHLPSLPGHLTSALPAHPEEGRDFGYLSALVDPDSSVFDVLSVIGGPTGVFEQLTQEPVFMAIEWKQSCKPLDKDHQVTIRPYSTLKYFGFESLVERPIFPAVVLSTDRRPKIDALAVTTYRGLYNLEDLDRLGLSVRGLLSVRIHTKSSEDHVPSIDGLWNTLSNAGHPDIDVVGLRASPQVTQAQIDALAAATIEQGGTAHFALL